MEEVSNGEFSKIATSETVKNNETLTLNEPKLYIVRTINPYGRKVTNQELASKGLAIGNNLDKDLSSSVFQWSRDPDGTMRRQFNMPLGKWPVWIASDMEQINERYLNGGKNEGGILYVARIDLNNLTIGTNLPFEYIYSWETGTLGSPITTLTLDKDDEGKFHLIYTKSVESLQAGLRFRFDKEGRLKSNNFNGEYFLDNFTNPSQFKEERIYRFEEGQYKDITPYIKSLRDEHRE